MRPTSPRNSSSSVLAPTPPAGISTKQNHPFHQPPLRPQQDSAPPGLHDKNWGRTRARHINPRAAGAHCLNRHSPHSCPVSVIFCLIGAPSQLSGHARPPPKARRSATVRELFLRDPSRHSHHMFGIESPVRVDLLSRIGLWRQPKCEGRVHGMTDASALGEAGRAAVSSDGAARYLTSDSRCVDCRDAVQGL
jgi:hypothetical protein